jgi:hypothetical protein
VQGAAALVEWPDRCKICRHAMRPCTQASTDTPTAALQHQHSYSSTNTWIAPPPAAHPPQNNPGYAFPLQKHPTPTQAHTAATVNPCSLTYNCTSCSGSDPVRLLCDSTSELSCRAAASSAGRLPRTPQPTTRCRLPNHCRHPPLPLWPHSVFAHNPRPLLG